MAEVRDVIKWALLDINVLAAGDTPTADDADLGLEALNNWIDAQAADRLQIYKTTRTTWTISSGDGEYTVGSSANVNVARPVFVDHVNFIDTSVDPDLEYPLASLTPDGWSEVRQKALTALMPTSYYYDTTFPTGTLYLWPVPTSALLQGALYAPQAVAEFESLDDVISLPPGYRRMLVKNLAVELAPSYGRKIDPVLAQQAMESMGRVKRINRPLTDLRFDAGALVQGARGVRSYNIVTGD